MARGTARARRRWRGWLVELLVLSLLAFAVVALRYDLGERWFGWGPVDPAREPAAVPPPQGLRLPARVDAPAVADPEPGAEADPVAVARALTPLLRGRVLGPRSAVLVTDLTTGAELFRAGADRVVPASTTKILTAIAALDVLTPQARFATTVRWLPAQRRVVLVGGGDPYLERAPSTDPAVYPERADLATLARRTAAALREQDVDPRGVRLSFDDSLFSGPEVNPTWLPAYLLDVTSGISALWVDQAEDDDGFGFAADPAAQAAGAFAAALRREGVRPRGQPTRLTIAPSAPQLAQVESAPVAEIVERMLATSDNQAADVLAHQVGLADRGEGSFAAGAAATLSAVRRLGVPTAGARLLDGSGLSRENRLPLATLAAAVRVAAQQPRLRPVLTGLPVAGFTGSLAQRFGDGPPQALGRVRAKTGTLRSVHALAGLAETPDGVQLAFVVAADRVRPERELEAQLRLDRLAGALGACRCGVGS